MPYNGVGLFTSLGPPTFPAVTNAYILASYFNATMNDVFTGLSTAITRDGQSAMIGNLPMGGNKITGLGTGTLATDAVTFAQVFTGGSFTGATLANTTFTGTLIGPTAAPGTNTTQLATTAFVAASFAPLASPALTGVPTVPTAAPGTNTTQAASTAFVMTTAFNVSLPGQSASTAGKFTRSDGTNASWVFPSLPVTSIAGAAQTAVAGVHYLMTNAGTSTLTLPAAPADNDEVWVTFTNGLYTNVVARNGKTIYLDALDFTINAGVLLTWKWKYFTSITDWKSI